MREGKKRIDCRKDQRRPGKGSRAILSLCLLTLVLATGCLHTGRSESSRVDYSDQASWLALPKEHRHEVDLFFVYPTTYQGEGLQDITDPRQKELSREPLRTQASVFEDSADIYCPMYRQLGKSGFSSPDFEEQLLVGEQDIKDALTYYLEHYNQGRPFIIAAHSQGSSTLASLLRKIWGTTGAEDRLVAAYLIGFSITEDDLEINSAIRMSSSPEETGCFIAYNSVKDGVQDQSVQILDGAVVTNPLDWVSSSSDGQYVPAQENLGAVFFTEEGEKQFYDHYTSAQIKDGGLVCEVTDPSVLSEYPIEGIYHRDDYSLFYQNIKKNVQERIEAFL